MRKTGHILIALLILQGCPASAAAALMEMGRGAGVVMLAVFLFSVLFLPLLAMKGSQAYGAMAVLQIPIIAVGMIAGGALARLLLRKFARRYSALFHVEVVLAAVLVSYVVFTFSTNCIGLFCFGMH